MATFSKITLIALLTTSLQLVASGAALAIGKLPSLENNQTGVHESAEVAPVSRSLMRSLLPSQTLPSLMDDQSFILLAKGKLPGGSVGRPKSPMPGSGTR